VQVLVLYTPDTQHDDQKQQNVGQTVITLRLIFCWAAAAKIASSKYDSNLHSNQTGAAHLIGAVLPPIHRINNAFIHLFPILERHSFFQIGKSRRLQMASARKLCQKSAKTSIMKNTSI
jgi:hypothetical protein